MFETLTSRNNDHFILKLIDKVRKIQHSYSRTRLRAVAKNATIGPLAGIKPVVLRFRWSALNN